MKESKSNVLTAQHKSLDLELLVFSNEKEIPLTPLSFFLTIT